MKKNFTEFVEESSYTDQTSDVNETKLAQEDSSELCFNIIQHEYNHVFERGNKLDNKVNITLTFTGVLFLFIIDLLNIKEYIIFPANEAMVLKIVMYCIIALAVLILYATSIYLLISIINPMKYKRFNTNILLEKNMQRKPMCVVYNYTSIKYSISIKENNNLLDTQFEKYKRATIIEMIMIGISICLYIFKYNFL